MHLFVFMVPPRLCLNKRTFEALKIKNSLFWKSFLGNSSSRDPIPPKNSCYSLLPNSHMSKLSYDTKIWKKCGPCCEQGRKEQINFFMKKSPNFPAICHFASLLHSTNMDLWIVSLAQIGPQAYKKVPQGQIWKKKILAWASYLMMRAHCVLWPQ